MIMNAVRQCLVILWVCCPAVLAQNQTPITPIGQPLVHPEPVHGIALSPNGKWAATGTSDNKLRLWDAATGKPHGPPLEHDGAVYPVAFSPDSQTVVAGGDKGAKLWDVATGKQLLAFP